MSANKSSVATFQASFVAAGLAEMVTLPIDITKIRLQLQPHGMVGGYTGMIDCLTKVARTEGPAALWKGATPALLRQCCYTSLMMVIFPKVRVGCARSLSSHSFFSFFLFPT